MIERVVIRRHSIRRSGGSKNTLVAVRAIITHYTNSSIRKGLPRLILTNGP